ncbi:hypothetical protein TNCV_4636951 [Trichonephila clavipes]|nr:hypothetical protein TNCV_4636951 [Trichonephila clavipes]
MADLLPRNRALPNTTSQRGDTSQVLPSMRSPSSALVAPFNRLVYSQILTRCVRALVPQKFSVEEELMHVKHVEVKSPHVGVMWKFGRGVISSDNLVALHFKYDQARRRFVEWAQNEIAVVPDFHKRILFSDEAHFWLNGYVNKQNCRIWSEANPQVYVETPLHPEKLIVWCALWAGGILLQKR